jgi:hypothetical protein
MNGKRAQKKAKSYGQAFVRAMQEDFSVHGVRAIVDLRRSNLPQYLRLAALILPKDDAGSGTLAEYEHLTNTEIIGLLYALTVVLDTRKAEAQGMSYEDFAREKYRPTIGSACAAPAQENGELTDKVGTQQPAR